ncbi:biotin/lipoyl-containing protein [Flammeovirga aprica]|uniref:Biotin/lipoyl-binding protein n=1 Tax=Flammeovirga aprica JL-4 TaxID=694437 RepID=A0A7X9RWD1_9BACT|nr:acetyl-CoA carboxylase biotin carboxyl carrier protein subunit [Flammeovirga aprica]NME69937.1 biotin/lipoyl-binding protein [Flammeovirga aprica JL-4]
MKQLKCKINGNQYNVNLLSMTRESAEVEVNGAFYSVELFDEDEKKKPTIQKVPNRNTNIIENSPKPVSNNGIIKAPLPGTLVDINVSVGDQVKKDDVVFILEAMKMENNILAGSTGTVKNVNVVAGQSVLEGEILMEIT